MIKKRSSIEDSVSEEDEEQLIAKNRMKEMQEKTKSPKINFMNIL